MLKLRLDLHRYRSRRPQSRGVPLDKTEERRDDRARPDAVAAKVNRDLSWCFILPPSNPRYPATANGVSRKRDFELIQRSGL